MAYPIWQATITDDNGNVLPGAEITVVNETTGLNAPLYSTRNGTSKTNPFFATVDGFAQFYAAPGLYRITATDGGTGTTQTFRYVLLVEVGTAADQIPLNSMLGTAATKNVGLTKGDVALSGDLVNLNGNVGINDNGGISISWSNNPPTFQKVSFTPYTPSFTFGYGVVVDGDSNGAIIAVNSNTGRLYTNSKGGSSWKVERNYIATIDTLAATGQSTLFPMTQKAVTDAINGISDERDKTEINEIGLGLEVIENIKTFSFKLNKRDWYRQEASKELIEVEEDGKVTIQEKINSDVLNAPLSDFEENDGSLKRDDVYTGFVAQDLKETLEALNLGHLGIVKNYAEEYEGGEDRFYIEHLALLPFLVNSVKQLSARVKELEDADK